MNTHNPYMIATVALALFGAGPAGARDMHVSAASNLAPVKCLIAEEGWVFNTTGPCSKFVAPTGIALGSHFYEAGNTHTINVIVATQMETDYPEMSIRAGEWYCAAAETEADLGNRAKRRIWLYVPKCLPLR